MTRIHKVQECDYCKQEKTIAAKGLCRACYGRLRNNGTCEKVRKRNTCKIDGCDKFVVTKGLCDAHRKRLARYGTTDSLRPDDWGEREKHPLYVYWNDTKRRNTLNICDEWVNDFWSFVNTVSPRPSKNHYIRAVDLDCELGDRNWQWVEGITDANRQIANREKSRNSEKSRVRASSSERASMLEKADGKCEICGTEDNGNDCPTTGVVKKKSLCVDHCHETGKLRGILCRSCNVAIGHFKDDVSLLKQAIVYLSRN